MRRTLIVTAATLALLSGAAVAQTTSPTVGNPSSSTSSMSNTASPDSSTSATSGTTKSGGMSGLGGQLASADELIGKNVYGRDNNKIGEVDDVILDANGQAKQLVISSGGFLGIGEKQVAVDYSAANWDSQNNRLNLAGMSRDDVKAMPDFKYDDTMTSLNKTRKPAEKETVAPGAAPTTGSSTTK
ncbi:sporulation protein YlmC with PRC-barrel domain [Azospirillum lipoferum]|uniref:PRC-barrel domain containing protein n=1 Tax=Azospirillum lipoferum TaxID=193 RepID=A0A5A9GV82_AZOLI|nr:MULTISPECIES: PRC-barrel domain-containing protein [Azospirillum]KAA0598326.1 PRC-barrel domain containing protein [Azospirillum lipoferum]MCP1609689.1 sporulation protein YlmC with PRC-barrel domain [Azospirillum lipoferum]MDW5535006.1 PRC-barrel domain-containing protein [Azospirillum sp. NL1]